MFESHKIVANEEKQILEGFVKSIPESRMGPNRVEFLVENAEKLEVFAESLAKKLLHGPVSFIKDADSVDPTTQQLMSLDLINKMFSLDDEGGK